MKKFLIAFTALLLLLCMSLSIFAESGAVLASEETPLADCLDFSVEGSLYTETLTPSELISIVTGAELCEAERLYVDRVSDAVFKYDTDISTDNVSMIVHESSGELQILADAYIETQTQNGVDVVWIPKKATLSDGRDKEFSEYNLYDHEYSVTFEDAEGAESVVLAYETRFLISRERLNGILSLAYDAAVKAKVHINEKDSEYAQAKAEYDELSRLFQQYLLDKSEFETKMNNRLLYLEELQRYNDKKLLHDEAVANYNSLKEEYDMLKAEYDCYINVTKPEYDRAYGEFLAYLDALDAYEDAYDDYLYYESNVGKYLEQLEIVEVANEAMTDGRSLYAAINGSAVNLVMLKSNRDLLVQAGVPKAMIEQARVATTILRQFYTKYFEELKSDEDRYFYYKENYQDFKSSVLNLLIALDYFYTMGNGEDLVYKKLREEGKSKKYVILLSQLYVVASALYGERIYTYQNKAEFTDSHTWHYYDDAGKKVYVTAISMLEGKRYLSNDINSVPYNEAFPPYAEKPAEPTEVKEPEPITSVTKPTAPTPVPDFDEEPPEYVEDPEPVEDVDDPGEPPKPYVPTEEENRLIAALDGGDIRQRAPLESDFELVRSANVIKMIHSEGKTQVSFYSSLESPEMIYTVTVDSGAAANFRGKLPTKDSDERYNYIFSHWTDYEGNPVDLSSVSGDQLYLYPAYSRTDILYTVTWSIDGTLTTEQYKYGDLPRCPVMPKKPKDNKNVYFFEGVWNVPIEEVRADVEYTALFTAVPYYKISWYSDGVLIKTQECLCTEKPAPPVDTPVKPNDSLYEYVFTGWDKEVVKPSSDTVYTATFKENYILPVGTGGAEIKTDYSTVTVDISKCGSNEIRAVDKLLTLTKGRNLVIEAEGLSVVVDVAELEKIESLGITVISINPVKESDSTMTISVSLLTAGSEDVLTDEICFEIRFSAAEWPNASHGGTMRLFERDENGEIVLVDFNQSGGNMKTAALRADTVYYYCEFFEINTSATGLEISVRSLAMLGERVKISLDIPESKVLSRLYYVFGGETFDITDGEFVMPSGNIWLRASTKDKEFTVSFVNYNGHSVVRKCKWGQLPVAPDFQRLADGKFTYNFIGWDKEIAPVYSDAVYTAAYESVPISEEKGENANFWLMYLILVYRYRVPIIISFTLSVASAVTLASIRIYKKRSRKT